jgi:ABC-2 type transport system permease protein
MKVYLVQAIKSFRRSMAYRAEVWLQIVGNVLFLFIEVSVWNALLGSSVINGIGIEDMVTYAVLNMALSIVMMTQVHNPVDESLKSGGIIMHLVKPTHYPLFLFADEFGKNAYKFIFSLIPILIAAYLLFGLQPLAGREYILPFIFTVLIGVFISFAIGYLIALVAFWFLTTFAIRWTVGGLIKIFSGTFFPLWFFTPSWSAVANVLPFKFLGFVPAAVYLGKMSSEDIYLNLILGTLWLIILYGSLSMLWMKALRRLSIQGG